MKRLEILKNLDIIGLSKIIYEYIIKIKNK